MDAPISVRNPRGYKSTKYCQGMEKIGLNEMNH